MINRAILLTLVIGLLAFAVNEVIKSKPIPASFEFADLNEKDVPKGKILSCEYSATTFEVRLDTSVISFGNFPDVLDIDKDLYTRPELAFFEYEGGTMPTSEQVAYKIKPYVEGARVLRVFDIKRGKCKLLKPEPTKPVEE